MKLTAEQIKQMVLKELNKMTETSEEFSFNGEVDHATKTLVSLAMQHKLSLDELLAHIRKEWQSDEDIMFNN